MADGQERKKGSIDYTIAAEQKMLCWIWPLPMPRRPLGIRQKEGRTRRTAGVKIIQEKLSLTKLPQKN